MCFILFKLIPFLFSAPSFKSGLSFISDGSYFVQKSLGDLWKDTELIYCLKRLRQQSSTLWRQCIKYDKIKVYFFATGTTGIWFPSRMKANFERWSRWLIRNTTSSTIQGYSQSNSYYNSHSLISKKMSILNEAISCGIFNLTFVKELKDT